MKTTILKMLCAAFTLALTVSLSAQDSSLKEKKSEEEVAANQTEIMAIDLDLTPEQTEKISEINLDFAKKVKEAKDRKAPENEFKTLYQNRDDSVQTVLTQEQFTSWKGNRGQQKKQQKNNLNK